jgi:lysophospholipase L1-like esterase
MRALGIALLHFTMGAAAGVIKIMPLGDSITWGEGSASAQPPDYIASPRPHDGGYRAPLYRALTDGGVSNESFVFVGSVQTGPPWMPEEQQHHEGHPGFTIAQVLALAPTWSAFAADIALIMLGSNDMHEGTPLPLMVSQMDAILNATYTANANATVLLASITMRGEQKWVDNVTAWNAAIPGIVAKWSLPPYNKSITFVDMQTRTGLCALGSDNPAIANRSDCCQDRVHPTQGGYSIMAGVWWEYLRPLLPSSSSSS